MSNFFSVKDKPDKKSPEDYEVPGLYDKKINVFLDEKLSESEMRYRRLFETAQDGILILDFETGNIVDANPFILEIIYCPLKEIVGKRLWEIGLFSNRKQSEFAFNELKTKNYIRFEDMPIQRKNGKIAEVEFISNVYLVNNKKVIQCNIREITERKQAEKRQEFITKILSVLNTQNDWQQLIDNILVEIMNYTRMEAVGIRLKKGEDFPYYETKGFPECFVQDEKYLCSRNKKGEIIRDDKGKPFMECMCGNIISGQTDPSLPFYTQGGSFYSNNASELLTAATKKERQPAIRNRCLTEGYESVALIPLYSGKEIIGLLQLNDKHPEMFSLEMIRFFEKTGNIIGIALNRIQNENKIKESEQNLKKQNTEYLNLNKEYSNLNKELTSSLYRIQNMNHQLIGSKVKAEESDKLKSAFLTNISHEIRTPMNAIMGFSDFLLQPGLSQEKIDKYVRIINASSMQLLSVISDIIDISHIEANQLSVNSELVDINNLLNELFVTYKKIIELKKIGLYYSCDRPNDLIQITTDGNRIKQVLCNLLNNAIKFTKEGKIEFGYRTKKNFIEFYVKDTGMGIAQENCEFIFQRFRQVETEDNRKYGGNGLGLSISKALVEKLGGTIKVDSEYGKGSTFTFTIPYLKKVENIGNSLRTSETGLFNKWTDKTILIVEDEINNHAYIEALLKDTKVKIVHAWDGREAVEHVKNNADISLVLMDIKMPTMDGYEAMQLIKQNRPELLVIAQTAYALSHDKTKALQAGFDGYIPKPITKNAFIESIAGYLN